MLLRQPLKSPLDFIILPSTSHTPTLLHRGSSCKDCAPSVSMSRLAPACSPHQRGSVATAPLNLSSHVTNNPQTSNPTNAFVSTLFNLSASLPAYRIYLKNHDFTVGIGKG